VQARKAETKIAKATNTSSVRASISFPPDLYETLEEIAQRKKVSLAWVVRDAAEKYVAAEQPQISEQRLRDVS
jgi:metal-responsive CopG/Arc/MetJ family transcriptional regulator